MNSFFLHTLIHSLRYIFRKRFLHSIHFIQLLFYNSTVSSIDRCTSMITYQNNKEDEWLFRSIIDKEEWIRHFRPKIISSTKIHINNWNNIIHRLSLFIKKDFIIHLIINFVLCVLLHTIIRSIIINNEIV